METVQIPKQVCPNCGFELGEGVASEAGYGPKPGAFALCIPCGYILIYDQDLQLRELTDTEIQEVASHPEVLEMQRFRAACLADPGVRKKIDETLMQGGRSKAEK